MAGRAARNAGGYVILYADNVTDSMKALMEITEKRRARQMAYNLEHNITPQTIRKSIRASITDVLGIDSKTGANNAKRNVHETSYSAVTASMRENMGSYDTSDIKSGTKKRTGKKLPDLTKDQTAELLARTGAKDLDEIIDALEADMLEAAQNLEFERAAALRDQIKALKPDEL